MTLEAIGQKLKSARESQGLSLRQIYERTKIPINHLQAIDSGLPDDLPEPVYVAGFIKRYAECIGLDGQVLADEYKRADIHDGNGNGKPKSMSSQPTYITPEYLKHAKIDNSPPRYKLLFFPLLIGIVVIGALHFYSSQPNNSQQDPSLQSLKDSVSPIQQTQNGTGTASPPTAGTTGTGQTNGSASTTGAGTSYGSGTASPTTAGTTSNDGKVILSATQHVWVAVKRASSGDNIYTGFLEQGDRRTFEDPQGITVTAGNGGSLSVESKGKIEPFGEPGKKSERTFSTASSDTSAAAKQNKSKSDSSTVSSAGSSTDASNKTKKTTAPKTGSTTTAHKWHSDDSGTRSIPGNDGMRSIDVPYRYSEGRLDAN
jgi:cytoskeletal protein RodZ